MDTVKSEKLLLINYAFPPYPGIGGRRWAKFAKYLAKLGYQIFAIHAQSNSKQESLYTKDIQNENIHRFPLPQRYPPMLSIPNNSLYSRIRYQLNLRFLKLSTKGNYFDQGLFWEKQLIRKASELIEQHELKNVIVSGAPFSLLFFAIQLKNKFSINLIADIRDPWTWGGSYGINFISEKRKAYENWMEAEVIKNYKVVFVPSPTMQLHLKNKYPNFESKIKVLTHGFDSEEICTLKKIPSEKIRLVFLGSTYEGLAPIFSQIADFIAIHSDRVSLDIYSESNRYAEFFKEKNILGTAVNYCQLLPPAELFKKFDGYDFALILQPDYAKDFITTKIHELIYSKTPILLVAAEGLLSIFIQNNNLGIHIQPEQVLENLNQIFYKKYADFDLDKFQSHDYSYEAITNELTKSFIKKNLNNYSQPL